MAAYKEAFSLFVSFYFQLPQSFSKASLLTTPRTLITMVCEPLSPRNQHIITPRLPGVITKQELGSVLKSLQINATDSEIEDMINEVDLDQTGTIDLEGLLSLTPPSHFLCMLTGYLAEFIKMMKIETKPASFEQEMRSAFQVFDSDGSGQISVDELRKVMQSFGEALSEEEIKIMIQEVDKDGDGQIDCEYNLFLLSPPKRIND